jgi:hypothetical protein
MLVSTENRCLELEAIRLFNRVVFDESTTKPQLPQDVEVLTVLLSIVKDLIELREFHKVEITSPFPKTLQEASYIPKSFFNDTRQTLLQAFHNKERFEVHNWKEWRLIISQHPNFQPPPPTQVDFMLDIEDDACAVVGTISPITEYTNTFIKALYLKLCDHYLNLKIEGYN